MTDLASPAAAGPDHPASAPASSLTQTHLSWIRTRLSVERTFMAWTRTAVSLIGFGFTIYQFLGRLGRAAERPDSPRYFGLAFILTGIFAMAVGAWQRHVEVGYLNGAEYHDIGRRPGLPHWRWSNWIAIVVILIGISTVAWIVLSP